MYGTSPLRRCTLRADSHLFDQALRGVLHRTTPMGRRTLLAGRHLADATLRVGEVRYLTPPPSFA